MPALFPLPAVIFVCCLVILLIILAIVYFVVLKDGKLCHGAMTGAEEGGEEKPLLSDETDGKTTDVEKGAAPPGSKPASPGHQTPAEETGDPDLTAVRPVETMEEGPGPSTSGDHGGDVGTPMTVAPPQPSTTHSKAKTPVAESTSAAPEDVGFIVAEEEQLCAAGKVLVSFTYMPNANKLNLKVIRTADIPPIERGGAENVQIHLCILPQRNQRFRTKVQPVSQGVFNTTFQFVHMTKDLLDSCAIRLRVYGTQRFSKRIIGETKFALIKIDLTSPLADGDIWKNLSPKGMVAQHLQIDEEDEPDDIDDWAD